LNKDGRVIQFANIPSSRYTDNEVVSLRIPLKVSSDLVTIRIQGIRGDPQKPHATAVGQIGFPPTVGLQRAFTIRAQSTKSESGDFEFTLVPDASKNKAAY
jgi:hypothetical protein